MEALTSSFTSSNRGHNGVQLDNIIFYSGPASVKTHETTPIDADEWFDGEVIFADASQQVRAADTEQLDVAGGSNIMNEGKPCCRCLYGDLPSNVLATRHPECVY